MLFSCPVWNKLKFNQTNSDWNTSINRWSEKNDTLCFVRPALEHETLEPVKEPYGNSVQAMSAIHNVMLK